MYAAPVDGMHTAARRSPVRPRRRTLALALLVSMLSLPAAVWVLLPIGRAFTPVPAVHAADAIVVLGGEWPLRMQRAIELYRRGLAPEIWLTGENHGVSLTASSVKLAREAGIPAGAIRVLTSANTWEDGQVAATLAKHEHLRSLLLVTSWYHSRRAICVMERQLGGTSVTLYYDSVPNPGYGADDWWQDPAGWVHVAREMLALAMYRLWYGTAVWNC